jgi:hypothetical protein
VEKRESAPQPRRRSESLPLPQLVLVLELAVEAVPVDEILLPVLGAPSVASATIWRFARCPQDCLEGSSLPRALRRLKPHEVEDVLCIFKDRFGATVRGVRRSWCG